MTEPSVSAQDVHTPSNDPATLNLAPGVHLTDLQRTHVAIVLDLWQRGGTMGKLTDNFAEDVMYEDHFAYCHNREELGPSSSFVSLPNEMGAEGWGRRLRPQWASSSTSPL